MDVVFSFIIQLAGFYILYSTSARAVFVKRKHNVYLYRRQNFSKTLGVLTLLASFLMFMYALGIGTGFLFGLTSIMTISGFMIVLLPLQKTNKY